MDQSTLVEKILELSDFDEQKRLLKEHISLLDDDFAERLKRQSSQFLRSDTNLCAQFADLLLYQAQLTDNPVHEALGWLAKANLHIIGYGDYHQGITLFDRIDKIYDRQGFLVHKAKAQIGKIVALAFLGRYDEALEIESWAAPILEENSEWEHLSGLIMNLAAAFHGRLGDDLETLRLLNRARTVCEKLEQSGLADLALIEMNIAFFLSRLGRYEESIAASQRAYELFIELKQTIEAARTQHGLAITYTVMGQYNKALELLDRIREIFVGDDRVKDRLFVDLDITDCLLKLRRFSDVLTKCSEIRDYFTQEDIRIELGRSILNEAIAYASLRRYSEAIDSLQEAQSLFENEGSQTWAIVAQLELAIMLYYQGQFAESQKLAQICAQRFNEMQRSTDAAHANLVAARSLIELNQNSQAYSLVKKSMGIGMDKKLPGLIYQSCYLLGRIAIIEGDRQAAREHYARAIQELEQLRGQVMLEFRVGFLEDKETIYENMVSLCLDMKDPQQALAYVEHAKSRALLDLLAYQFDLSIQAKSEADNHLVEELVQLRAERDRLYHLGAGTLEQTGERGWGPSGESLEQPQQNVLELENQITELWHKLLIRNADYAEDASFWQIRAEPIQPYLDTETILLEYFVVKDTFWVFIVTAQSVEAYRLPGDLETIQRLLRQFWLNLKMVPRSSASQIARLTDHATGLLAQLSSLLIAPIRSKLTEYPQIIIVPHGPLHYLPFHALYDKQSFLLEHHQISYLPSGSILRYLDRTSSKTTDCKVFGYSNHKQLPHTVAEANKIADLINGKAYIEQAATLENLRAGVSHCRVLHMATHGDFRTDNPLFSGLTLANGMLTTLDIFNLRLNASLVTLSACQTGRSVVGGGDELLGLMRAFLSAGADSLLLSMWSVEDQSTSQLMENFYKQLINGCEKSAALRYAQRRLMSQSNPEYRHPYFWAPFFLIGKVDSL